MFAAGGTLRMEDLSAEIARTRPLSSTMQERIQALRDWSVSDGVGAPGELPTDDYRPRLTTNRDYRAGG